jgi:hypothetical protein
VEQRGTCHATQAPFEQKPEDKPIHDILRREQYDSNVVWTDKHPNCNVEVLIGRQLFRDVHGNPMSSVSYNS